MPNQIRSVLVQYVERLPQFDKADAAIRAGISALTPQGHTTTYLHTYPDGDVEAGAAHIPVSALEGPEHFRFDANRLAELAAEIALGAPVGAVELLVITVVASDEKTSAAAARLHNALCRQLEQGFVLTGCMVMLCQHTGNDPAVQKFHSAVLQLQMMAEIERHFPRRFARMFYLPWSGNYVASSAWVLAKLVSMIGCSKEMLSPITLALDMGSTHGTYVHLQELKVPQGKIHAIIKNGCIAEGAIRWVNAGVPKADLPMESVSEEVFQRIGRIIDKHAPQLPPLLGCMPANESGVDLRAIFGENPVPQYVERCRARAEEDLKAAIEDIAVAMFRRMLTLAVEGGHALRQLSERLTEAQRDGIFGYQQSAQPKHIPPKLTIDRKSVV